MESVEKPGGQSSLWGGGHAGKLNLFIAPALIQSDETTRDNESLLTHCGAVGLVVPLPRRRQMLAFRGLWRVRM